MTGDMQGHLKTWQNFKDQAINGEFTMDHEIGAALRDRCNTLLVALDQMKIDAQNLQYLSGYGSLPSAQDLQSKFQKKATGGADHDPDDNAVHRIQQHIEVVKTMRDAYLAAIGELQNTDQNAGNQMGTQTEQVN
ncbi:hypothetical protein IU433_29315 [Nocardia puris]|uniref:hypothetical protein n=1 Tax=Nocardia puris TaxID=208602 RepID=UPI0018959915|nr:hypothetical protein [Nocardia puris]MBF6364679.1 hypothetical protein [Nocardia puris]MBF6463107.1 hypothetical protein [Nocardia puris]